MEIAAIVLKVTGLLLSDWGPICVGTDVREH
jgi:hypothetical protein